LPNVGPYIYDVSISGFTRSSIYIYDISSLRVKRGHEVSVVAQRSTELTVAPANCTPADLSRATVQKGTTQPTEMILI